MRAPPILPITAVAVVGVLAMSGLNAIDKAPKLLQQAKAFAEGAKPADPAAKPADGQTALPGQTPAGQTPASGQQPGAPNLPVACAVSPTDLANRFADAKRMSEALTNPPPEPVPPDAQAQAQPPQKPAKGKTASAKKGG